MAPLSFFLEYPKLWQPYDLWSNDTSEIKVTEIDEIEVVSTGLQCKSQYSSPNRLPTTQSQRNPTKKVSFQSQKRYRTIPSRKSFTAEEIANAWMTRSDYERAKSDCTKTYRLLDQGVLIDSNDTELCTTGIESTIRHRQRRKNYRAALDAVLSEQRTQKWDGFRCEDLIAMSYMEHTDKAQNRAFLTGVMMTVQDK